MNACKRKGKEKKLMVSGVVFGCACEDVFFLFHTFSYCFSKLPLVSNQCITI